MNAPIRWDWISRALDYYVGAGFRYVEVPWIVSLTAIETTLPPGREPFRTHGGCLVGSAEQSFVELALRGQLKPGRYVAASPCFRHDEEDDLHQQTFFKVELIELSRGLLSRDRLFDLALAFFRNLPGGAAARGILTNTGVDIELNEIEIGSYGTRNYNGWVWAYGTGLAEPRFSLAAAR